MPHKRNIPLVLGLALLLVFALFFSMGAGAAHLSYQVIGKALEEGFFGSLPALAPGQGAAHDIVWLLRLPRLLLAALTGAGLAVAGVVMQALVRNPLADPYILGVSSGASLGAAAAILLGIGASLGGDFVGIAAFVGAFLTSLLVLLAAHAKGTPDPVRLLLAGMAVSAAASSASSFIIYFANDRDGVQSVVFWLMGSFGGARWETLAPIAFVTLGGIFFFFTQSPMLDLMLLGDADAMTLGRPLGHYREIYLLVLSLLIGFLVYVAGMIGFVGLVVPHVARLFTGASHRHLLPVSALMGATLLVVSDALARSLLASAEIPVGLLVSLIGAPTFVYLLARKRYRFNEAGE